jgi:hypothetical protein
LEVEYPFTDEFELAKTVMVNVTVRDDVPPTLDFSQGRRFECGATVQGEAYVEDNCDPNPNIDRPTVTLGTHVPEVWKLLCWQQILVAMQKDAQRPSIG